jgi:maleate isomerase
VTSDRLTVGVVTPHAAPGPEIEIPAMSGGRIATVLARTGSPTDLPASTTSAALDQASTAFGRTTLSAVAHASTTTGYVIGHRAESALRHRLSERFGVPAVTSCAAAVGALRRAGVERVQLVHPPWFDADFDDLGPAYFHDAGFDTVVTRAAELPHDPGQVDPAHVVDWVEGHLDDRADGVYLAGNGFRTAPAVDDLEGRTGRVVVSANSALVWGVLVATGTPGGFSGYGGLLRAGAG